MRLSPTTCRDEITPAGETNRWPGATNAAMDDIGCGSSAGRPEDECFICLFRRRDSMFRVAVAMSLFVAGAAHSAESKWPVVIPAPNGAVILASEVEKGGYDEYRYAAVASTTCFIS